MLLNMIGKNGKERKSYLIQKLATALNQHRHFGSRQIQNFL